MFTRTKRGFRHHDPLTILVGCRRAKNNIAFENGDLRIRRRLAGEHGIAVRPHLSQINLHGNLGGSLPLGGFGRRRGRFGRCLLTAGWQCRLRGLWGFGHGGAGAVRLRFNRGLFTIIKKHNGERHDRDRGPSAEQDIGDEPHETDLFAGEKLLSA